MPSAYASIFNNESKKPSLGSSAERRTLITLPLEVRLELLEMVAQAGDAPSFYALLKTSMAFAGILKASRCIELSLMHTLARAHFGPKYDIVVAFHNLDDAARVRVLGNYNYISDVWAALGKKPESPAFLHRLLSQQLAGPTGWLMRRLRFANCSSGLCSSLSWVPGEFDGRLREVLGYPDLANEEFERVRGVMAVWVDAALSVLAGDCC